MLVRTVLRAASAWFIWRWLAPRWKSTLGLVVCWGLIIVLHSEYVEYVEITERTELLWVSYLVKWGSVLTLIAAYAWFVVLAPASPPTNLESSHRQQDTAPREADAEADDGFDFLRHKPRLESEADRLIRQPKTRRDA